MKTKDLILQKALELFNKYGIKTVTLRSIAVAIEISQGNLNYHYKSKANIVKALYYELVRRMDINMDQVTREQPILSYLYNSSLVSMKTLYDFRFITRDLPSFLDTDSELKLHYMDLQKVRKKQFAYLFQNMIAEGLLRKEELSGEYERLYIRMNILGDNWIYASDIFDFDETGKLEYCRDLLFEVIYPYLTSKGKISYLALVNEN